MERDKEDIAQRKKLRSKWALALRRYIIESNPNENYAPFFGLDSKTMKRWIELQFKGGLDWGNYAKSWQFDHIVPVVYFDYYNEEDLKLCWNFINIRVEPFQLNKNRGSRIDVLAVRTYFERLYNKTGFSIALKMLNKINSIEVSNIESNEEIENFIIGNKQWLENIATLNNYEFNKFNQGWDLNEILAERELLKKFGS
jgi:hypothetical protein